MTTARNDALPEPGRPRHRTPVTAEPTHLAFLFHGERGRRPTGPGPGGPSRRTRGPDPGAKRISASMDRAEKLVIQHGVDKATEILRLTAALCAEAPTAGKLLPPVREPLGDGTDKDL